MIRSTLSSSLLSLLLVLPSSPAAAQERPITSIVRDALPAVVFLRAYDNAGNEVGQGSGFAMGDGRIATNVHVIAGAARVEIFDGENRLLGAVDHASSLSSSVDLAILPALGALLASLPLASAEPEVGESIVVLGSPQGLTNTASEGIVSAVRTVGGRQWIQITAPISSGSSGGPVLNRRGQVVGVSVSQMREGQNLNFAVPVRDLRALASGPGGRMAFPGVRHGAYAAGSSGKVVEEPVEATTRNLVSWAATLESVGTESTTDGFLGAGSDRLKDGSYYDSYRLSARLGQTITIVATSTEVDTYLLLTEIVSADSLTLLAFDDNGTGNSNAMIVYRVASARPLVISVNSLGAGSTGNYKLFIIEGDASGLITGDATTSTDTRWTEVSQTDRFTRYMDAGSIRRVRTDVYEVWIRSAYNEQQVMNDGTRWDYTLSLMEMDCRNRRNRTIEISYYTSDGRVQDSYNWRSDTTMSSWRPGTVGESTGEAVCAAAR